MNCKPGDLAVMVRSDFPENIGKLFHIIDLYRCDPGEWRVRTVGAVSTNNGPVPAGKIIWCDDFGLRPLRDPGDDAQDEMIQLLGKPESIPA